MTELLVPYPPQPFYLLRPPMVSLLERASERRGITLLLYAADPRGHLSAWRSHSQQQVLYTAFLNGTGPVASNPDTGTRPHMRGCGSDLLLTDAKTQKVMRAEGATRDPSESWHWNLPGYLGYPIIPNLIAAGLVAAPTLEDPDMTQLYYNKKTKARAVSLPGRAALKPITAAEAIAYGGIIRAERGLPETADQSRVTASLDAAEWNLLVRDRGIG